MYLANNEILKAVRGFDPSSVKAEMHDRYIAGLAENEQGNNRVLSVAGDTATINIQGVLTKSYTMMTWWLGGTAYDDISGALSLAENDPDIKKIIIKMNSGGGQVSGLFDLIAQIQSIKTEMECFVSGACCSAAYAIATQCGKITASSEGETFGSVGIVVDMYIDEHEISITSTNAPKKRPDAATPEGVEDIRAELDQYEELFLEAIAEGRNTTVSNVIATYGQGASTTARNALKSGMIDSIKSNLKNNSQGDPDLNPTATNEESSMNIAELQAKHPELYASVIALGRNEEQERVSGFAELGEASGATDLAMQCIKDGTQHSAAINAKFMAANMKNMALNAMADDNVNTDNIDQSEEPAAEEVNANEKAAAELAAEMGVQL